MPRTVLIAGASGALGRRVARLLHDGGWRVRALARDPARLVPLGDCVDEAARFGDGLDAAVAGADVVFSCLGASVLPGLGAGWRGFRGVDLPINRALVDAAARARVARFTYVSCHHTPELRRLAYVAAHEGVVDALRASSLDWSVVRPTGFFSAIGAAFVDMAKRGVIPAFGRPDARTNPIHDDDLAAVCVEAIGGNDQEIAVGGPEVVTRRQMGELAFAAVGKPARFVRVPAFLMGLGAFLLRPFHPRNADLFEFFGKISQIDLIAPARGSLRLAPYIEERAAA